MVSKCQVILELECEGYPGDWSCLGSLTVHRHRMGLVGLEPARLVPATDGYGAIRQDRQEENFDSNNQVDRPPEQTSLCLLHNPYAFRLC